MKCSGYESIYSFYDDVKIIISTPYLIEGNLYARCPLLIDESFIEVDCTEYVKNRLRSWIRCSEQELLEKETRNWCQMMLYLFSPREITPDNEN